MPNMLSDIAITHISLVKQGANGKTFIYKSAVDEGEYKHTVAITKTDEEKGMVYGIVYAPDQVDSQGDFATANEIEKAAYGFMKARNTTNVDVDHSFNNEDAFVAETWILKGEDAIFPDEPVGSWAVGIKLESKDLQDLAKAGSLQGLSMAGQAQKTEVEKGEQGVGEKAFSKFFAALANATTGVWVDFGAYIAKSKHKGELDMDKFAKIVKEKIDVSLDEAKGAAAEMQKTADAQAKEMQTLQKQVETLQDNAKETAEKMKELEKANQTLQSTNDTLAEDVAKAKQDAADEVKAAHAELKKMQGVIEKVQTGYQDLSEVVKASKQSGDFKKIETQINKNAKVVM